VFLNNNNNNNNNMSENILNLFIEKGFILDKEVLNFLSELNDEEITNEILNKIAIFSDKRIITKNLIDNNIEKIKPALFDLKEEKKKLVNKYFVNISISLEVKKEISINTDENINKKISNLGAIKIISSPLIKSKKLEVKDFIKHFKSRYNFIKKILQNNANLNNLISIDKITGNEEFSIIGMVNDKSFTKNKNIILEVEDVTGSAKLLINQNKEEIYKKAKNIILDDIIGFKCSGTKNFLYVKDFLYPDCYISEKKRLKENIYALFISDIHVGSNNFLEKNFLNFISWINKMEHERKEIFGKIKYLFVVGDTVEGVGVYPGQEKELIIKDIKKQYEKLAEFYSMIPKHIQIIQCAGQHDGVRVPEPQPPVGKDFGESLHKLPNVHLVSNPSLVEIKTEKDENGIKVLMYHGASMHGVISEIEELRFSNAHSFPSKVIKHLLLRRHLAPIHGLTSYIPGDEDSMIIKEVPDIITTGDLHKTDISSYNNILIIANSCWQSMTAFEEKVGNTPDPCKVPILNLKTREIKILDFSSNTDNVTELVI
jgi:DNA polymerase II small subunit